MKNIIEENRQLINLMESSLGEQDGQEFPDTAEGAIAALKYMASSEVIDQLDFDTAIVEPDPDVEGVWSITFPENNNANAIMYLPGFQGRTSPDMEDNFDVLFEAPEYDDGSMGEGYNDKRDFKARELEFELGHETDPAGTNYAVYVGNSKKPWKIVSSRERAVKMVKTLRRKGRDARTEQTTAPVSESNIQDIDMKNIIEENRRLINLMESSLGERDGQEFPDTAEGIYYDKDIVLESVIYEGFLDSAKQFLGNKINQTAADIQGAVADMKSAGVLIKDIVSNPEYLEKVNVQLYKGNSVLIKQLTQLTGENQILSNLWDRVKKMISNFISTKGWKGFLSRLGVYGFLKFIVTNAANLKDTIVNIIIDKLTDLSNIIPSATMGGFLELFNSLDTVKKYFFDVLSSIKNKLDFGANIQTKGSKTNVLSNLGLPDKKESVEEGYILKKANVSKYTELGDPDEWQQDINVKDTDYEIINNKTGKVVGTASWSTNDYFGPGAMKITMKNGATRWLDVRLGDDPQSAFNRFVKNPKTSKKYKDHDGLEESYTGDSVYSYGDSDHSQTVSYNVNKREGDASINISATASDLAELKKILDLAGVDVDLPGAEQHDVVPDQHDQDVISVNMMPDLPVDDFGGEQEPEMMMSPCDMRDTPKYDDVPGYEMDKKKLYDELIEKLNKHLS